jgi:hypothetical protein
MRKSFLIQLTFLNLLLVLQNSMESRPNDKSVNINDKELNINLDPECLNLIQQDLLKKHNDFAWPPIKKLEDLYKNKEGKVLKIAINKDNLLILESIDRLTSKFLFTQSISFDSRFIFVREISDEYRKFLIANKYLKNHELLTVKLDPEYLPLVIQDLIMKNDTNKESLISLKINLDYLSILEGAQKILKITMESIFIQESIKKLILFILENKLLKPLILDYLIYNPRFNPLIEDKRLLKIISYLDVKDMAMDDWIEPLTPKDLNEKIEYVLKIQSKNDIDLNSLLSNHKIKIIKESMLELHHTFPINQKRDILYLGNLEKKAEQDKEEKSRLELEKSQLEKLELEKSQLEKLELETKALNLNFHKLYSEVTDSEFDLINSLDLEILKKLQNLEQKKENFSKLSKREYQDLISKLLEKNNTIQNELNMRYIFTLEKLRNERERLERLERLESPKVLQQTELLGYFKINVDGEMFWYYNDIDYDLNALDLNTLYNILKREQKFKTYILRNYLKKVYRLKISESKEYILKHIFSDQ